MSFTINLNTNLHVITSLVEAIDYCWLLYGNGVIFEATSFCFNFLVIEMILTQVLSSSAAEEVEARLPWATSNSR